MLTISQRLDDRRAANAHLVLPFELRQKSRLRTVIDTGEEVGLNLERGYILRGGDRLLADDGRVIEVIAAPEKVSVVSGDDAAQLARVAYHLGNRHVSVQVAASCLIYLRDHVLDDMVRGLGSSIAHETLPFEPEAGAYSGHSHANILLTTHSHG